MTGLVDIGASGAKRAPMQAARDFALGDLRLVVFEVESTCQIAFMADGWPGGPRKVLSNLFCDGATAAQLRAVADDLDGCGLPVPVGVADG